MRFRLLDGGGAVLDEGDAVVELAGGALAVSPGFGQPLRVSPGDIVEIAEPEPYLVRLLLADGAVLELSRLGAMRTQLLAELGDVRARDVPDTLLLTGVGRPEAFPGWVGEVEAQLQLYDDALVLVPVRGDAEKVPYPFVRGVTTDPSGYRVTVEVIGRVPLAVHRLARRTTEFVELLGARHRAAAGRTAAFLGALLPGLGALGLRTVAASLRDGVAAARTDLDRVDGSVWPALAAAATLPDRADCLRTLEELGTTWIGFKQLVSVERPAEGVWAWHDSAITPDLGDHGSPGSTFGSGYAGAWTAGMVGAGPPLSLGFEGPFQAFGPVLAYSMLGTGFGAAGFGGSGFGNQHRILPRADVERGRLVPAHTDLDALTAGGAAPTVRAFVLCLTPTGRVVYEALNDPDHATYVYRGSDTDAVAAVNRALDLTGFAVDAVHDEAGSASSRYRAAAQRQPALRLLREAYLGRTVHTDEWADQLARHLAR